MTERFWHVWLVNDDGKRIKHLDLVKAYNGWHAEEKVYMYFGQGKSFTKWQRKYFVAELA